MLMSTPIKSFCAVALLGIGSWVSNAAALTPPQKGAVAFPATAELGLPFPAGYDVKVIAGYGPNAGSGLHVYTESTWKANEHYALDLVIDGEPSSGKGLPVVTPLAGKVLKSGWATSNWRNYGQRLVLEHDLGDGHKYHSVYAHLDSIAVSEGMAVRVGQQIGTLGGSCNAALSCSSFSAPHLHWAIHRDAQIGGSGTGGSLAGNAVVPEPLDGAEDLTVGRVITSTTVEHPECGDGACNGSETPATCKEDCRVCQPIPAAGRVLGDSEACFERLGPPMSWHLVEDGHGGDLSWMHVTRASKPANQALWKLELEQAGAYDVEVYTKKIQGYTPSKKAKYTLSHGTKTSIVTIDQGAKDGWQKLGTFVFAKGAQQSLRLDDNTWESLLPTRQLLADAIRITPASGDGKSDAIGTADDESAPGGEASSGCAFHARAGSKLGFGVLLLLVLVGALAARRRRRSHGGREPGRSTIGMVAACVLLLSMPACTNDVSEYPADEESEDEPLDPMDMSFEMPPLGKDDSVHKLPPLKAMWDAYPMGGAAQVKKLIGGSVDAAWITNTCTVRLSRAMNYGGYTIPGPTKAKPMNVIKGGDAKWYAFRVRELSEYLRTRVGKPDIVSADPDDFVGKKGIIKFTISGGTSYTGHFDLWDGTGPKNNAYFGEQVELWLTPEAPADAGVEGGAGGG